MPDPILLDLAIPPTTTRMVERYIATRPLLAALRGVVEPLASRHGGEAVSPGVLAEARDLLATADGIVSHQRGARRLLALPPAPDWTTLLAKIELALASLERFREAHTVYDEELEADVWRDETWLDLALEKSESAKPDNSLYDL